MKINQMPAAIALMAGAFTACGTNEVASERSLKKTAMERTSSQQTSPSARVSTISALHAEPQADETASIDYAYSACAPASKLFHCITRNGKEIKLCDLGKTIEYSFGKIGKSPEIALSVPREEATTSQWQGIGRWISYSITIPRGDTKYTLFTSVDRMSDEHESEAGAIATVGSAEVARILCKEPIIHNIEGVDLRRKNSINSSPYTDPFPRSSRASTTNNMSTGATHGGAGRGEPLTSRSDRQDAYGIEYGIQPSYEECMTHQPDGTSTAGYRQNCADLEFEFQDARLNRIYRKVMDALKVRGDEGTAKSLRLRDRQRAWLKRIETMCAAVAEKAGSSLGPAAQSTCFMDQTAIRAHELEREYGGTDK